MKLRAISENLMTAQMRDAIITSKALGERPQVVTDAPHEPSSGNDPIGQASAALSHVTGVPHKPRHRKFFGMENRPGTIRL